MNSQKVREILDFWFTQPDAPNFGKSRQAWFQKDQEFDQQIRHRFFDDYQLAKNGELNTWQEHSSSCLALILLLDQFPRNLFRGDAQAFATDDQALAVAKYAVAQEYDQTLVPVQRWFIYLPFEHSENLADQQESVKLFQKLKGEPDSDLVIDYAIRHLNIIARFGRFPHRNQILNRPSTPEEIEFLQQPGSSF